jgi:hypothetical protein
MAGLSFLGSGVGTLAGLLYTGIIFPAALFIPAGLFVYGWAADKRVHWIVPEIGTVLTGFGMIGIVMCVQTYLVDAFTIHAASVIAASAVLRSLVRCPLPTIWSGPLQ